MDPDRPGSLVDAPLFCFLLDREVQNAARLQYCVSVLSLTPDRFEANTAILDHLARLSVSVLRATDVVARVQPSCVAALLVGAETCSLRSIHQRIDEGVKLALDTTVSAGGACYPRTALNARELLRQALNLMFQARHGGGHKLYVS